MKKVYLVRTSESKDGTFGLLFYGNNKPLVTLELPWRDNKPNVSCIPKGDYKCRWQKSPRFGWTYEITKVKNRSRVLIHAGNLKNHTHGCLLLGTRRFTFKKGEGIGASRIALRKFNNFLDNKDFKLRII